MQTINVIGLGSSDIDNMPLGIWRHLTESDMLYLRTTDHPVVEELANEGAAIHSFDHLYEENDTFEATYDAIAEELTALSKEHDIDYVVPGHPLVYETTTELLLGKEREGAVLLNIIGGRSFIDVVISALKIPVNEGFQILDATTLVYGDLTHRKHTLITQVYDRLSLGEAKLTLLDYYQPETRVKLIDQAGGPDESIYETRLSELDHIDVAGNLLTLYIPKLDDTALDAVDIHYMTSVFDTLVSEDGCPWDKVQTHESIEKHLIEEAYEVIEAIEHQDDEAIVEELGDILLQVALHSAIANKDGYFNFYDVLKSLNNKVVRRHPHVFGEAEVKDMDDLGEVWQKAKEKEGKTKKVKYEKEYGDKVLTWIHETIHNQVPLSEIVAEKRDRDETR